MNKVINSIILIILFYSAAIADEIVTFSKKLMPGVVTVYTETGIGSGFIIDKDGYILTNAHVVSKLWDDREDIDDPFTAVKERVAVLVENNYQYPAQVIGYDARVDVAVLKIIPDRKLTVLKLGDSDKIKLGEKIVVLGSPFGLEETATAGVISHVGRPFSAGPGWEFPVNVIQTDAAINPGNSGGPMINMKGEVIGINYASTSKNISEGIGFAIPINIAKYINNRINTEKAVKYSYLGMDFYPITNEFSQAFNIKKGLLVETVYKKAPAEKAGIKTGDVIISMNNKEVSATEERQANDYQWEIATFPINEKVTLELLTQTTSLLSFNKTSITLQTVESPLTEIELKQNVYEDFGFAFKDITVPIYLKYSLPVYDGIWVSKIMGPLAIESELQAGDVINKVDEKPVKTSADFKENILAALKNKEKYISLEVLRGKSTVPLFFSMRYTLTGKKVIAIVLSDTLPNELYETVKMASLFYGVSVSYCGMNGKTIDLIENDKEKGKLEANVSVDDLTDDSYDAVIVLGDKLSEKYASNKNKITAVISSAMGKDKVVAVEGSGMIALAGTEMKLGDKRITFAQKYVSELQKYKINPTGTELEIDEKLITATGSKESYKPFTYQIIKLLKN
ncbi:MAG: trypsin-like peptidase domain-containing protein [Elusimicrobia bacterium]|nr:trypsin-like peptidase domain-containing protein [Elusimicrobiota bacterium]